MPSDFARNAGFHALYDLQREIIRIEYFLKNKKPNHWANPNILDARKRRHKQLWESLKKKYGKQFKQRLEDVRKSLNETARENLDLSDGTMYDYVIPKFKKDGSHKPWSEKDVPWRVYGQEN